jgi:hypothetical protein
MRRSLFCGRGGSKLGDCKMVSRSGAPLVCLSLPSLHRFSAGLSKHD